MKRFACLLCAMLLMALSVPALANSWNLPAGLAGPFERDRAYDSYVRGAADADTRSGTPRDYAFFVMQTQEHAELFVLEQGGKGWSVACRSTKALHQPGGAQAAQCTVEKADGGGLVLAYPGERYTFRDWGEGTWLLWEVAYEGGATMHIREDRANGYVFDDGEKTALWAAWEVPLDRFNISQMPKSIDDVLHMNAASVLADGRLADDRWEMLGVAGGTAEVYTAPSRAAYRAANGKAAISLGAGFDLLRKVDGWYLVDYTTGPGAGRFGYIAGDSFVSGWHERAFSRVSTVVRGDSFLTDDPQWGQRPLCALDAGQAVDVLAVYDPFYAYVETALEGKAIRGFMPLRHVDTSAVWAGGTIDHLIGAWRFDAGGNMYADWIEFKPDGTCVGYYDAIEPPYERYEAKRSRWMVCPYEAGWGLFWNETSQMIVFFNDDGTVQRYGLVLRDGEFSLTTDEGGGGFVKTDEAL